MFYIIFVLFTILTLGFAIYCRWADNWASKKSNAYWDISDYEKRKEYEKSYKETIHYKVHQNLSNEWQEIICWVFGIFFAIIVVIMSFCIIIDNTNADIEKAELMAEYEVLVYQYENNIYNDGGDDVVGKKALFDDIKEWNKSITYKREVQDNFWWGIYYPNIYDEIPLIELK